MIFDAGRDAGSDLPGGCLIGTRLLVIAGAGSLVIAGGALAGSRRRLARAPASRGTHCGHDRGLQAIKAKIAARQSLRLSFPDLTEQEDIIDYGVNDLRKTRIDGECVSVAYMVTNPDPGLAASMAAYDVAMDEPPANITEMALPAPGHARAVCWIECSTGGDRLDAEAIHSMASTS